MHDRKGNRKGDKRCLFCGLHPAEDAALSQLVLEIQTASPLLSQQDIAAHVIRRFQEFTRSVSARVVADQIWTARRA